MAKFYRREDGVGYLIISTVELAVYSDNLSPVCDGCLRSLTVDEPIILIPYCNEAYDMACGRKRLATLKNYPKDDEIREQAETFYKNYFKIENEEEPVDE